MKKTDNKLVKTMMLGTLAFMMMCSCKATAAQTMIIKCTNPNGKVIFQDFACADEQIMQLIKVETSHVANN